MALGRPLPLVALGAGAAAAFVPGGERRARGGTTAGVPEPSGQALVEPAEAVPLLVGLGLGLAAGVAGLGAGLRLAGLANSAARRRWRWPGAARAVRLAAEAAVLEPREEAEAGAAGAPGFFDPLGPGGCEDEQRFCDLSAAELKHGRVVMLAVLGALVQHYAHLPGFEDVPSGLFASGVSPGSLGMLALFAASGVVDLGLLRQHEEREPGDSGDPMGLGQYTVEMRKRKLDSGRLAMVAAAGLVAAASPELLYGEDG